MSQHYLPKHLQHEPIFALPYFAIDGEYAGNTDGQFLTIGNAQWDRAYISAKVMRYSDRADKWIRGSEELPVHRVLDLAKMVVSATTYRFGLTTEFPGEQQPIDVVDPLKATKLAARLSADAHVQRRLHDLARCLIRHGYGQ